MTSSGYVQGGQSATALERNSGISNSKNNKLKDRKQKFDEPSSVLHDS
jgi:hypothetical protein